MKNCVYVPMIICVYYNGDTVINETKNGTNYATNLIGRTGIEGRTQNGTTGFFVKDLHGDVRYAFNASQIKIADYTYTAWGNEKTTSTSDWAVENPIRYNGQYLDNETGFYYLRARYYDPSIHRFTSEDPHWDTENMIFGDNKNSFIITNNKENNTILLPDELAILQANNLYSYCANNPVIYNDPNGQIAGEWFLSEEEAAKDFADIYNPKSIQEDAEYGAYIYAFLVVSIVDNKSIFTVYYSYGEPIKGEQKSIDINTFKKVNGYKTAIVHTHGRYSAMHANENFSGHDIISTREQGLDRIYVATPGGKLKVCNVNEVEAKAIANIPFDYKSPDAAWWRTGGVKYGD